jgi:hypothetical protein
MKKQNFILTLASFFLLFVTEIKAQQTDKKWWKEAIIILL